MLLRIIIVDDLAVATASNRLIHFTYPEVEVATYTSTAATISAVDQGPFDLAILTLHLADGSGVDLARWLRSKQPALPIVFITGQPGSPLVKEACTLDPYAMLEKPFLAQPLRTIVGMFLRARD